MVGKLSWWPVAAAVIVVRHYPRIRIVKVRGMHVLLLLLLLLLLFTSVIAAGGQTQASSTGAGNVHQVRAPTLMLALRRGGGQGCQLEGWKSCR